ncbi:MAG: hypothetical protein OXC13_18995 [Caldilineaceae bacterium]|nr:hypothetical protein [Caldilineaceae bacterium]
MQIVGDLLASLRIRPQYIAHSELSTQDRLDRLSVRKIRELGRVVAPGMVKHRDTPLGEMLSGLFRYRFQPTTNPLPKEVRSYSTLRRAGVATWDDVAKLAPEQLFESSNEGQFSDVIDIVTWFVEQALHSRQTGNAVEDRDGEFNTLSEPVAEKEDSPETALGDLRNSGTQGINVSSPLGGLRSLAAWGVREREAEQLGEILELKDDVVPIPADLSVVWDEISQVALADLADRVLLDVTLDDLVKLLFVGMDKRQRVVYRRRVIDGATLAKVSKECGVTRERVRQLQGEAEKRISASLRSNLFGPLRWRAADLRMSLGVTAPIVHNLTQLALDKSLRGTSPESAELLRSLLLRLAGPYQEHNGWITLEQADIPDPASLMDLADEFGVLLLADAYDWLTGRGMRPEFHDVWLEHSGRFRCAGEHLMVWSRNVVDKSVALLAVRREPADANTLVDLVGEGHNVSGVRARFFDDERLMRVNRTDWALRAWELEEYTGITDEITQRIEEAGGQASLDALVNEVVRQFNVKEFSVLAYTSAPMFLVENGLIRLRGDDEPFEVNGSLQECTGAFRSSERTVSLLISADAQLLRGSSRMLNGPVAVVLGVVPGQPRSFSHADGVLNVTWPMTSAMGPSLGSVRVIATKIGATASDRIRLDFDIEDGKVNAECVPRELDSYEKAEAIRLLTGISTDLDGVLDAIAEATDTSPTNARYTLQKRGDADLVSLLPVPEVDPQLESTLSDLARMISQH